MLHHLPIECRNLRHSPHRHLTPSMCQFTQFPHHIELAPPVTFTVSNKHTRSPLCLTCYVQYLQKKSTHSRSFTALGSMLGTDRSASSTGRSANAHAMWSAVLLPTQLLSTASAAVQSMPVALSRACVKTKRNEQSLVLTYGKSWLR